jgi:hypothetical protein
MLHQWQKIPKYGIGLPDFDCNRMVRKSTGRGERWCGFSKRINRTDDHKRWAGDLARNTQDVTAVVNRIEVLDPDIWDYQPAFTGLQELWRNIMSAIPFLIFGIVVLVIFWGISCW